MQLDGHLCRRAFDDLDLLVPPQCLVRAKALLQEEGFAPFRHADGAIGLCGPRGLIVELHWAFSPKHERFPLPVRQVMERAGVVDVAGYWTPFQRPRTCCSCFASTERSTPGSGSSGSATSDGCWKHAPGSPGPKCGSDRAGCAAAECCWWA
jgi:hypothetical protein